MSQKSNLEYYKEPYRPQFHFSPEKMWMNDPNGMVYQQGNLSSVLSIPSKKQGLGAYALGACHEQRSFALAT